MCIGNEDGGDDAVGPFVAKELKKSGFENTIDCGTTPENYTSVIKKKKPEKLIIVDAIDMGLKSGEIRIVPKEKIGVMTISTHGIPVSVLIGYLGQYVDDIILIGIQPKTMNGDMTNSAIQSAKKLVKIIKDDDFKIIEKL